MSVRLNVKNTHIKVNFVMFSQRRKIRNANLQKKRKGTRKQNNKDKQQRFFFILNK